MIKPLGKVLVEYGFITNLQLSEALLRQKSSGGAKRMGDILLEMGMLSQEKLDIALQKQQENISHSNLSRGGATSKISGFSQAPPVQTQPRSPSATPDFSTFYQPPSPRSQESDSPGTRSKGHMALVQLLIKKGIISMEEYFNEIQSQ